MKKYFLSANTAEGYVSFFEEEIKRLKFVYTLSGRTEEVFEKIKKAAFENNADELILNPTKPDAVCGCIWRGKQMGLFCESSARTPKNCEAIYKAYSEAKKIHDEWEKIYISNMNAEALNKYTKQIIEEILDGKSADKLSKNRNRFFGASTSCGSVNFIDDLTEDLNKRYFIKGRPGTGKSTFLKRLREAVQNKGFDTETYYCSFDPQSLDMVIVRELSLCVFDSTAPHEKFPESERDIILDFYKEAELEGVDEKYKSELSEIAAQYEEKIKEGKAHMNMSGII